MTQLTPEQTAAFERALSRLSPADLARVAEIKDAAARAAAEVAPHWDFELAARAVDGVPGEGANDGQRRVLVAAGALELPGRIAAEGLPHALLSGSPIHLDRRHAF